MHCNGESSWLEKELWHDHSDFSSDQVTLISKADRPQGGQSQENLSQMF